MSKKECYTIMGSMLIIFTVMLIAIWIVCRSSQGKSLPDTPDVNWYTTSWFFIKSVRCPFCIQQSQTSTISESLKDLDKLSVDYDETGKSASIWKEVIQYTCSRGHKWRATWIMNINAMTITLDKKPHK